MMTNIAFGIKQTGKEEDALYDIAYKLWVPPLFVECVGIKADGERTEQSVPVPCQTISDKALADCVEALIGAFYNHGGALGGLELMKWLDIDCFFPEEMKDDKQVAIKMSVNSV